MTTSSQIRECIDYLNQAYFDLAQYPKNVKYHWITKGQISDRMFELDALLDEVDRLEALAAASELATLRAVVARQDSTPPAG